MSVIRLLVKLFISTPDEPLHIEAAFKNGTIEGAVRNQAGKTVATFRFKTTPDEP